MEETENGARKRSATGAMANGVIRKVSPSSPTRSPGGTEQRTPSAGGVPGWLILDRIVHRSTRRHRGVVGDDDATASALAHDCVGRPVRASLRIADPPAVSRLYLHWKGTPAIDFAEPAAVAAHGHAILFRMRVPFEDPVWWSCTGFFPVDYFVYSASSSPAPPTLTLLPPCFTGGGDANPKSDKYFQPYPNQRQRTMLDKEMGILCHGDHGEFTVADLTQRSRRHVDLCLLHHHPPLPRPGCSAAVPKQWKIQKLQIPPNMKINLSSWRNDVVVPVGGRRLCWVDYYQGLLLIDVVLANSDSGSDTVDDQQQLIQFIPLPSQALRYRRPYRDAGVPDPFRCVSVTDAGIVKLVCILTKQPPSPYPFTITTWILDDAVNRGEWRKDVDTTVGAKEFFDLCGTGQSCLPLVRPSFPMVSLVDPDVICFLLKDEDRGLFWIIAVNMRNKKLQSSALYISEEEEEGYPPNTDSTNNFVGHNFIPSKFSSFLSEDAITSRELSEMMQKAKQRTMMMQKNGLEGQLKE